MKPKLIIASCIAVLAFLNSCSAQTKNILNENELSIVLLSDSVSYYSGILTKDVKVTTISFDTLTIKKLIKENKEKYNDRLRVFVKLTSSAGVVTHALKIVEIASHEEVFSTTFPLTKADKDRFNVNEFSWEPANPVEIVEPTTVMVPESEDFPSFLVVIKKDKSVWYNEKTAENDTLLTRVAGPIKENLKKIIAAYKDKADKENIKPGYYIKGDNSLEYPQFKEILNAFKENDIFKYKLVTLLSPEDMLKTSSEPSTLNLFMPKDEQKEIQTKANDSGLTLLLLKNNILAYNGDKMFEAETYDYKTIHQLLMTQSKKYGKEFIVIIKPAEEAPYKATVDILDEMTICEIKRYAIVDLKPVEKEIIKKFNSVNGR